MAFGAASGKHGKPSKTKVAKQHKVRPATPPKPPAKSSGSASMQLRLVAALLVTVPASVMVTLAGYLVVHW